MKFESPFKRIFLQTKFPESVVNNLSLYLKNNLNNNQKISSSKYI